jgi:hypothetical protein
LSDTSRRSVVFHGYFYLSINKIGCYNLLIDCCLTSSEQYFSSIIYKNCLEMREGMDQPCFYYHWRKGWINRAFITTEGRDGSTVLLLPLREGMDQPCFDYHWGKGWINCVLTTTEGRDGSTVFWLPLREGMDQLCFDYHWGKG